jgi:hypothetical protein
VVVTERVFGNYNFVHVCILEAKRDAEGNLLEVMPQSRYAKAATTPLNKYGAGPFVKFKIPNLHRQCGVYAITVGDDLKYIGEAANLASRYNAGYGNISPKNCFKGGQETNCRLNNLIYGVSRQKLPVNLWFHPTDTYKAIELELRRKLSPEWNRI